MTSELGLHKCESALSVRGPIDASTGDISVGVDLLAGNVALVEDLADNLTE